MDAKTMREMRKVILRAKKFQEEADKKGFGRRPARPVIDQYPHCDAKILHVPGQCEYCDGHPDWQELREAWGIAFTGECPAEQARPLVDINRWGGNVSTEHVIQEEPDAVN